MNRVTALALMLVALALGFITIFGNYGLLHLLEVEKKLLMLSEKNQELGSEVVRLENKIHAIENSKYELERKSRQQLGLSKPGEIVYIFPPETSGNKSKRPRAKEKLSSNQ